MLHCNGAQKRIFANLWPCKPKVGHIKLFTRLREPGNTRTCKVVITEDKRLYCGHILWRFISTEQNIYLA